LGSIFNILEETEFPVTSQVIQAREEAFAAYGQLMKKWEILRKSRLTNLK